MVVLLQWSIIYDTRSDSVQPEVYHIIIITDVFYDDLVIRKLLEPLFNITSKWNTQLKIFAEVNSSELGLKKTPCDEFD